MKLLRFFIILSLSIAVVACSKTKSENLKTSKIYNTMKVMGDNVNTVTCQVAFQVNNNVGSYIELSGKDTVLCNGVSMTKSQGTSGEIYYVAKLPAKIGETYSVSFSRADEGPYTSTAVLPEPILNASPKYNENLKKGAAFSAVWSVSRSAATDGMTVILSEVKMASPDPCPAIAKHSNTPPERGILGFDAAETVSESRVTGVCRANLIFNRESSGNLANGLNGEIKASQQVINPVSLVD